MYFVELQGSPRLRGQAYGETLRTEIHKHIEQFWQGITQDSGQDPGELIRDWLNSTNFLPAVQHWTPDLFEEVAGIGEGAGLDFNTIFSWQLLDELGWYIQAIYLPRLQGNAPHQCSTLAAGPQAGGTTLLAQNWDSHVLLEGSQTLLHVRYPGHEKELYVLTAAGRIGPFGLSSRGIGVCLNSLNEFLNFSALGLPVVFMGRGILEQPDYDQALAFVQTAPHATAQNYTLGGAGRVASFECSANQVHRYLPHPGAARLAHTNHPLSSTDFRLTPDELEALSPVARAERQTKELNSTTRFNCIQSRLGTDDRPVDLELAKEILRSHDSPDFPVCGHIRPDYPGATMMGMVMEFSTPPVIHVASGRPCQTEFKPYFFNNPAN